MNSKNKFLIIIILFFSGINIIKANELWLYKSTPLTKQSQVFSLKVKTSLSSNWQSVDVDYLFSVHYARLAASGELFFEITVHDSISKCLIKPERAGVKSIVKGNKVIFSTSNTPSHLLVQINGLEHFCLLVDPIESDAPNLFNSSVVNVKDFVNDTNGKTDETENLQEAVNYLYETKEKNILYFPSGIYKFRNLNFLKRTKPVTIYIEDGALLKKMIRQTSIEEEAFFKIISSKNINIKGRGVIDSNGRANFELWSYRTQGCPYPFWIQTSENITIKDILVRNSGEWSMHGHDVQNFTLSNYKVIVPVESSPEWTDGINISCGENVLVKNCFTYGNDDIFASGQYIYQTKKSAYLLPVINKDSKNFIIRNHFGFTHRAHGVRLGILNQGNSLKNYVFENCDFIIGNYKDGGIIMNELQGGFFEDIKFINCSFETGDLARFNIICRGPVKGKLELINCTFDYKKGGEIKDVENLNVVNLKSAGIIRDDSKDAGIELTNVHSGNWSK